MSLVQTLDFGVHVRCTERDTEQGIGDRVSAYDHIFEFIGKIANGTGASKINAAWSNRVTLSSALALDLRGAIQAFDGSTVTFPIVMGVFVKNLSTTSGESIAIGGGSDGAGTAAFANWVADGTDKVNVGPGGFFALWDPIDGYATTATTADILRFEAATGSPEVDILVVGRSA